VEKGENSPASDILENRQRKQARNVRIGAVNSVKSLLIGGKLVAAGGRRGERKS